MIFILVTFFLGIMYRVRGGGWFTFKKDIYCRLIWSISLTLSYLLINSHNYNIFYLFLIPVLVYASLYVPHSAYQNMGTWPSPQKSWTGLFLPTYTQTQWTALPQFARMLNDFLGMSSVGLFRGLIIFVPSSYFKIFPLWAILTLTLGQPIAYFLGIHFPLTITSSLKKRSAEFGELFNGMVYAACLLTL